MKKSLQKVVTARMAAESNDCVCAVKNGGKLPFNHNGEVIWVKPLVYDCGSSCRCPPTCQNIVRHPPKQIKGSQLMELSGVMWEDSSIIVVHQTSMHKMFSKTMMSMPHVMLFAAKDIPSLLELTYDYNYTIGEVRDEDSVEKVKHCYCTGPSNCNGRLY